MKIKSLSASAIRRALLLLFVAALVVIEIAFSTSGFSSRTSTDLYNSLVRIVGGLVCIIFIFEFSYEAIMSPMGNKKGIALLAVLPAFAVAVNNFPFVSFLGGDCQINADLGAIALYALFCLSVGFFEEMAFRGCVLMLLLKKRRSSKLGVFMAIFWSSVVFGLIHLVNLFISSPVAVLLQIGYSALIGGLCSLVLLATKNIWLCVLLHSVYNFAGGIVPAFGSGVIWTAPEVVLTAVVAVIVTLYSVWLFINLPLSCADALYEKKSIEK